MHITTERQCIACRKRDIKQNLLRISNGIAGIVLNDTKKQNGRAVYICKNADCINLAIKKKLLNKAFSSSVPDEIYDELRGYIEQD